MKYQLTIRFIGAAILAIVVAAVSANFVIGQLAEKNLVESAEKNAVRDALHIQSMIRRQMPSPLTLEPLAGPDGLPRIFPSLVEAMDITKFNVFDLEGVALWSTDPNTIAVTKDERRLFQEAAVGGISSRLVRDREIADSEGNTKPIDIVETHLALREAAGGRIIGVLEIYRDVSGDVVVQIADAKTVVLWTTVATMGALFVALVGFIVVSDRAGQRAHSRETAALQRALLEQNRADQTEARFRSVFRFAPVGIAAVDAGSRIVESNSAFQDMFGYAEEELVSVSLTEVTDPDDLIHHQGLFKELVSGERDSYFLERPRRRADGTTMWFHLVTSVLPEEQDGFRCIAMVEDVTERKEAESARLEKEVALARTRELQRSQSRLIDALESQRRDIASRLHGSVQSKLILVLHSIVRFTKLLPKPVTDEAAAVRDEIEDLIENDIRRFSVQIYPDILRRGLVPALESLGDRTRREIRLEMYLDRDIAKREKTDADAIPEKVRLSAFRIVEEAFTNALKHAHADKLTLALDLTSEGWLRITVSDDGQGLDAEAESNGQGLGTMRDYAEVIGGECVVQSSPGIGTAVTATLPLEVSPGS